MVCFITETKLLGEIKPSCVGQYVRMKVENLSVIFHKLAQKFTFQDIIKGQAFPDLAVQTVIKYLKKSSCAKCINKSVI